MASWVVNMYDFFVTVCDGFHHVFNDSGAKLCYSCHLLCSTSNSSDTMPKLSDFIR